MGVDWIPCRVEADCPKDELCELVRREAMHFRTTGWSWATSLDPRISFSDPEREHIRQAYLELGPLHRRLLFKYYASHRVNVISLETLFPVEWRLDAERTILPWELDEQLARWQGYREDVAEGNHRPFLEQLYVFVQFHDFVTVDLYNFLTLVQHSLTATGGWAQTPEVVACRSAILAEPILTLPPPPRWPDGDGPADLSAVDRAFATIDSAVRAWNDVVRRGNYRSRPPERPPGFEQWVAGRLADEWYPAFLA